MLDDDTLAALAALREALADDTRWKTLVAVERIHLAALRAASVATERSEGGRRGAGREPRSGSQASARAAVDGAPAAKRGAPAAPTRDALGAPGRRLAPRSRTLVA